MTIAKWLVPIVASLASLGCCEGLSGPISTEPLYSDDTLAAEPSLEGTWNLVWTYDPAFPGRSPSRENTPLHAVSIAFLKKSPGVYDFTYTDRDVRVVGVAHLVRLGRRHFLDLEGDFQALLAGFWPTSQRLHVFLCVGVKDDSLAIANMNLQWLAETAERDGLPMRQVPARLVEICALDASTAMLQELVHQHSEEFYEATRTEALYRKQPKMPISP